MAGVLNQTERQYNIRGMDKDGSRVTVRLKPGFNVVDDKHWAAVKDIPFVQELKRNGRVDFGKTSIADRELDAKPEQVAMSKTVKAQQKKKD